MVHLFPYWDFSEGEEIDVRIASNAPQVELFVNGTSYGKYDIDHKHGKQLLAHYKVKYVPGTIEAVAYDENGNVIWYLNPYLINEDGVYFVDDAGNIGIKIKDGKVDIGKIDSNLISIISLLLKLDHTH